jgi:HK97 family phage prohead protease
MSKRMLYSVRAEPLPGRSIRFIASTDNVCRDRGIVETRGWDTAEFSKNPVFLWAHQADQIPLGRVVKTEVTPAGLVADVEFAGEAEKNDRAECVFRMFKAGFLSAVSVGFNVLEQRGPSAEERKAGAEWVATRTELLEISAVPVPADPDALAISRAIKDGTIREADARYMRSLADIDGWKKNAKAVEDALAASATETVAAPTTATSSTAAPARALTDPYLGDPAGGEVVAIVCASCGTHLAYCPSCGDSFESDSGAPAAAPNAAPAAGQHSNKDTSATGCTDPAANARTNAGDGAKAPDSSYAEWWARLGALFEDKKN